MGQRVHCRFSVLKQIERVFVDRATLARSIRMRLATPCCLVAVALMGGCASLSDNSTPPLPMISPPPVTNWPNAPIGQPQLVTPGELKGDAVERVASRTQSYADSVSDVIESRAKAQERAKDIRANQIEMEAELQEERRLASELATIRDKRNREMSVRGLDTFDLTPAVIDDSPDVSGPDSEIATASIASEKIVRQRPTLVSPRADGPSTDSTDLTDSTDSTNAAKPTGLRNTRTNSLRNSEGLAPEQTLPQLPADSTGGALSMNEPLDPEAMLREMQGEPNTVGNFEQPSRVDLVQRGAVSSDALSRSLDQRAQQQPDDVSAQLDAQLLRYLRNEPVPQVEELDKVTPEDRELVSAVLDGLVNFRNTIRSNPDALSSDRAKPLIDMAERIKVGSDLRVANVTLCKSVRAFGVYEPIDPRFVAGQVATVVLYSEVENFKSALMNDGKWQTRLAFEVRLYTELGMEVWSEKSENVTDSSRRRRTDFFVNKMIRLPANLTVGRYVLKATVRDLQANRVAEASLPIQFVSRLEGLQPATPVTEPAAANQVIDRNK